ncbi:unnamed protein product [Pelagomonas calceolata]|uniref:Uncharacterized protein n=1 Tax=Pelagomonas calceolata TaxID=35677 RepID=A0A8J2S5D4_9STRA|nr:unnamed protein product [Pelagomonas calceolata]
MDEEDDQSSIVESLRGGRPAPLARPLLDDAADEHSDSVEVLFAETARAQRRATDLESASPHFACVIGAFSHRATAAMLAPLWFATLVGPYFTGPSLFIGDGGWLGGLALTAAIISVPLQYWIRHLANNWPSSYDACLRARVPEDEEGEGTSASLEVATKSAKPPGSTMLRLAAVLAPLLSVLGFALAIAFYVDDVEGAACLRVRTDQGVEYVDRTPYYPWDCAWESAASLCARLAGAVCAPLSILPPAAFAAHALALRAALRRGGGEEEAAPKALVDDANDLWRPASAVWFLACSVFMVLGARDACRGPSARGWLARHDRGAAAAVFVFAGAAAAAPALLVVRANAARREDDAPAFVSPLLASPARALVVCAGVVGCGVVAARISS